eukprot:ctg_5417.g634
MRHAERALDVPIVDAGDADSAVQPGVPAGVGPSHPMSMRFVRRLCDKRTDSHAVIVECVDRVVVCFRGTKSLRNIRTDLNSRRVRLDRYLGSSVRKRLHRSVREKETGTDNDAIWDDRESDAEGGATVTTRRA